VFIRVIRMRQFKHLVRFDLVEGPLFHEWVVQESSHPRVTKAKRWLSSLGFLFLSYLMNVLDVLYLHLNLFMIIN
jgi:hypothetical protein